MQLAVLGCGLMGSAAIHDLTKNDKVERIIAVDADLSRAMTVKDRLNDERIVAVQADVGNGTNLLQILYGTDAILGAVSYHFNVEISKVAIQLGAHFCDLGGNNKIVDRQMHLSEEAEKAGISIIPDCGLAPGMVSVVVSHGISRFDSVDDVRIRVGGLPQDPQPPLQYAKFFSIDGLINEYVEPVRVIRDGELVTIPPLTEIEPISFPEPYSHLEAFATSGGTSTLVNTYRGVVRNLDYKTIRYPGHCDKIRTLYELGFFSSRSVDVGNRQISPRELSRVLLAGNLPSDAKDVVLVQVVLIGSKDGKLKRLRYRLVDQYDEENQLSAMMRTTAFPAVIISQMQADGRITCRGTVPQEIAVPPEPFLEELRRRNIEFEESWSEA
jgi:lysine 6-dehydrogenase